MLKASTVNEYISIICNNYNTYCNVMYRGQINQSWKIMSSALRLLEEQCKEQHRDPQTDPIKIGELKQYHKALINGARKIHEVAIEQKDDISILAHLQHNFAKTLLIDYTYSPLIALWFACVDDDENIEDGCVYAIKESFTQNIYPLQSDSKDLSLNTLFNEAEHGKIYVYHPSQLNQRIINQQSVFLISTQGYLNKDEQIQIIIPKESKKNIIDDLSTIGISRKTIFPDFAGYIKWFQYNENNNTSLSLVYQACDLISSDRMRAKGLFYDSLKSTPIDDDDESIARRAFINHQIGYIMYKEGDYSGAIKHFDDSIAEKRKRNNNNDKSIAKTTFTKGMTYTKMGEYENALKEFIDAKDIFEKNNDKQSLVDVYNRIANIYKDKGDYSSAERYAKYAEDMVVTYTGIDSLQCAYVKNGVGSILTAKYSTRKIPNKNFKDALDRHNTALGIFQRYHSGGKSTDIAYTHLKIADLYLLSTKKEDWEQANRHIKAANKTIESYGDTVSSGVSSCTANAKLLSAKYYFRKKDYKKALEDCDNSIKEGENCLGVDHIYLAEPYFIKGEILSVSEGDKENEARECFKRAQKIYIKYGNEEWVNFISEKISKLEEC